MFCQNSKLQIFIIVIISLSLFHAHSKIDNNIFDPKIFINKEIPTPRLESAAHRFSIKSTDPNYQLSGDVYQTQQNLDDIQMYNLSSYKKSQSCTYFKSVLQIDSLFGQTFDYTTLQSHVSETDQLLYIIGISDQDLNNKKFLKIYSYNASHLQLFKYITFDKTSLNSDINFDIYITNFDSDILFSDGNSLYKLQKTINKTNNTNFDWIKVGGFNDGIDFWQNQQFIGFSTVDFQSTQLLLFLYTEKIIFYEYASSSKTIKKYMQIEKDSQLTFEDVQISQQFSHIYALVGNKLYFYRQDNLKNPIKHQLAGEICTKIFIFGSTIHIICQYEKRNFIGQYYYDQSLNNLVLNRFYNDIEDYRFVSYLKNYQLIVGQNDILLTSYGVNRKILLQMPKNPYSERFTSFGIERMHLLNKFQQQPFNQTLMAIGQDFLVLFKLKLIPAQIWCYIQKPPQTFQTNILMVRNTTQCQMNSRKSSLKSICMNLKPVELFFQHYEIESNVTSILVIIVILLVCVLAFLCLGCVFRQNSNYNNLVAQVKEKIRKIKSKGQQLKQI